MGSNFEIGQHTVQIRLDDDPAQEITAREATESETLMFLDGQAFASSLLGRKKMVFGFTPFEAPPAVATFNLTGIDNAITPLREACGW
ncbi:MAG: hypothetical protein IT332_00110 [Ardenticatenales bacterium]|nr:hypothetical protein [Ardenticatenales bacterium]